MRHLAPLLCVADLPAWLPAFATVAGVLALVKVLDRLGKWLKR